MTITPANRPRFAVWVPLLVVLLVALALRMLLWGHIPRAGLISDEGEYLSAASWLADGRGFSWYQGYLWTRAPLYVLLIAAHLRLFGDSLAPLYATQTLLSLLNVALVYVLARWLLDDGRQLPTADRQPSTGDHRRSKGDRNRDPHASSLQPRVSVPTLAAALMAIYLPFALYAQVLLSETLFITLLLGGFLALARWIDDRRPTNDRGLRSLVIGHWSLAASGLLFGLATLTRSLTLAFLPVIGLWLLLRPPPADRRPVVVRPSSIVHRLWWPAVFLLAAGLTIIPWTIYNSRLYGGLVVVDTTGAFNLMLGARTAYDGNRNDAATRDFALALLDRNLTSAQRRALLDAKRAADGTPSRDAACLYRRGDPGLAAALSRPVEQISQAERQRLMTAEAACLIEAKPLAFAQKSLGELVDLFQINYTGAERFAGGFGAGRLPRWYAAALFLLDDTIYVLALPLAVIGWAAIRHGMSHEGRRAVVSREDKESERQADLQEEALLVSLSPCLGRGHSSLVDLIGLWWLYNVSVAPLLFAINRFRLPLLPFAFIFAAYALAYARVNLPGLFTTKARRRAGMKDEASQTSSPRVFVLKKASHPQRPGWLYAALAALLFLVAATPYAYFEPRPNGEDSAWASYLGPYPSSLAATLRAWSARPGYLAEQRVKAALGSGDAAEAQRLLASADVTSGTLALARPLLAGLAGRPDEGLRLLDQNPPASPVDAAVLRGDLLRRAGDLPGAKRVLGQTFVDNANPVQFAWDWLHPPALPGNRIDLAGDLDLGYVEGCYLGEGDPGAKGTFRWCADGARLRFPGAGTGAPQELALRVDGRGWASFRASAPPVRVLLGEREAGSFAPDIAQPTVVSVALPASPAGADVIVTLRGDTFVADAARYLSQQGKSVVGQAQRLCVRIDWAELRGNK